jgi:GNAT superfamily N-acetyltransferase
VARIKLEDSLPLRHQVLRPHQSDEQFAAEFGGERLSADDACFAALDDADVVISTVTLFRHPPPWLPETTDGWQLAGMATDPRARGQGWGAAVVQALLSHVAAHGGGLVWCRARLVVVDFYSRLGFKTHGEPWEVPPIGTHVMMTRRV